MSLTTCNVHFTQQSDKAIYLSSALQKQLKLTNKKTIQLKFGRKSVQTRIRTIRKEGRHLYIPNSIRQSIRVPNAGNCLVISSNDDELQMGPLIGVLTDGGSRSAAQPFGARSGYMRALLRTGSKKAYFFGFTPADIDWQAETVNGYFLSAAGGWVKKTIPLPDVVYNRLTSRRSEGTAEMQGFKERFLRRRIPIFNWDFFTKSQVYDLLESDPEAYSYVPESYNNPTAERVKEMLEKHQFVYLKPTGGSLGNGIFRVTYHPKQGYFARYRKNGSNVLLRFSKFSSLMNMLQSRQTGRLRNYVIQQGIRLIEIDNCPIDFRFHMHKDGKNEWVVAGVGAKKAGKGSVTTHVRSGGQLMTPEYALGRVFGSKSGAILENAKSVSIRLAEAIERNYSHLIGELGFDIGIDKDERVWMFEANAKPGRSIFKHPALKAQGMTSLGLVFEHCLYLSRFRTRRDA